MARRRHRRALAASRVPPARTDTLRLLRRSRQLTQAQLAKKAGVDHSLISLFESGQRDWRRAEYAHLVHIARVLNLPVEELFPIDDGVEKAS